MPKNMMEISFDKYASDMSYLRKPKIISPGPNVVGVEKTNQPRGWRKFHDVDPPPNTNNADASHRPDTIDIIDRSMDIQQILFEMAQHVNAYFCFQALMVILSAFIIIVFDCYYLLDTLTSAKSQFRMSKSETLIFLGYQLMTNLINVVFMVIACSMVTSAACRTGRIVHKIMISTTNEALRRRLMQFSHQLDFNRLSFTAFGMFNIDATLLYAIAGATTTYLIILVQIKEPPNPVKAEE